MKKKLKFRQKRQFFTQNAISWQISDVFLNPFVFQYVAQLETLLCFKNHVWIPFGYRDIKDLCLGWDAR